jgi:hypothetical protein
LAEVGEDLGIGRAGHERVEHRATRYAEQVRCDAVELDVRFLQRLVQPVGFALALGDLRLAIARQLTQIADRPWAARSWPSAGRPR